MALALAGTGGGSPAVASANLLNGPSVVVGLYVYLSHPELAPAPLGSRFWQARQAVARVGKVTAPRGRGGVFNGDTLGRSY